MNRGPYVFLGCFAAVATSFFGMVLVPQLQLGSATTIKIEDVAGKYPSSRSGLAQRGAEVYRQLGCNHCHSQQVSQESIEFAVRIRGLKDDGVAQTAQAALVAAGIATSDAAAGKLISDAATEPALAFEGVTVEKAASVAKRLGEAGLKAEVTFRNVGRDLERGWGVRFSAAQDYVHDPIVLAGSRRMGPDLANVGMRQPEDFAAAWKYSSTNTVDEMREWHLKHLADPRSVAPGSTMPSYKWLFEKSGDALRPTQEAEALVAYLMSLRQDVSLPNAPLPAVAAAVVATNAPAQ